jgi:Fuc2NAc and GlcNAc transferase
MKSHYLILYIAALFFGAAGAWLIGNYGFKLGLIDRPNKRSSHSDPTPKGGGTGILIGFLVVALSLQLPAGFWGPAVLISMLSFAGDRLHLSPSLRLFFQFLAGLIFLVNLWLNSQWQIPGVLLIIPLLVFVVGTANFYNFMDGINGIAAITGVVGFGLLSFYSISSDLQPSLSVINTCIALSCLGFLPFNIPKAHVFMGDVGSILLGFVFAAIVIWMSANFLDFICLSAFMFMFYADELTTMVVRIKDGESPSKPHRRHLYQILANEYAVAHWKISAGYGFFQLVIGSSILALKDRGTLLILLAIIFYFCCFSVVSAILRKRLGHEPLKQ